MATRRRRQPDGLSNSVEGTPEILRIEIDQIFRDFLGNPNVTEYIFTSNLNNLQRKYIHEKAQEMSLTSKSYGKEPERQIHIKKQKKIVDLPTFHLESCDFTNEVVNNFIRDNHKILSAPSRVSSIELPEKIFGKLKYMSSCTVAEANVSRAMQAFKNSLPIFHLKRDIMETIRNNPIVIVSSETGSGKTTQIPQYIMEDMKSQRKPCKIICTQPRRISTVGVAERVAAERGESVGQAVGYHIRLEQKYSMKSNLIYVTNGVMLRTLMNGPAALKNITHIIIDEVHERDRLSDFLLICLKQNIQEFPDLRIILMSATVNIRKFQAYFNGQAEVLTVPGRLFPIDEYFLDDILETLQYMTPAMRQMQGKFSSVMNGTIDHFDEKKLMASSSRQCASTMDAALEEYLNCTGDLLQSVSQLWIYIFSEELSVDYQHSANGRSALMIAAYHGDTDTVAKLCEMGANIDLLCFNNKTCLDYASDRANFETLRFLENIKHYKAVSRAPVASRNQYSAGELLKLYDQTQHDDSIDFDLIVNIICKIEEAREQGAILVFLPGYDDIMMCNDKLESILIPGTYRTFFLHGSMSIRDQHEVFKHLRGQRKIILSTNIAETSITIDDVVYVIDSGRAKEKCYDAYNKMSSLQVQWISKACSKQRAGRAGRTSPGKCFHIYSRQRFDNMDQERVPEMLRVSLEELCLHTKILAPHTMCIHDFLTSALDPPSPNAIKVAIDSLVDLGAMHANETLTPLGEYLTQLSVEPHLGKMLIFAIIFKCLEPILTYTAAGAHKDPFQLPPQANLRSAAQEKRKALSEGILSDHVTILKAFLRWQSETAEGRGPKFCNDYFISKTTMETILESRRQLLSQLRAAGFVSSLSSMDEYNNYSRNWALVKAVICCGLYPNLAYKLKNKQEICTRNENKVFIQNTSALSKVRLTSSWLMYDELVKNRQSFYIRNVTAITPISVALVCGNHSRSQEDNLCIDDWLAFVLTNPNLTTFRGAVQKMIKNFLSNPDTQRTDFDLNLLRTLNKVLLEEDKAAGLRQADGIGERPRFFHKIEDRKVMHKLRSFGNLCTVSDDSEASSGIYGRATSDSSSSSNGSHLPEVTYRDNPIYVLIKPKQLQNVHIAFNSLKWVFAPQTEKKLVRFLEQNKKVILVFAVRNQDRINGIAELINFQDRHNGKPTANIKWLFMFNIDFASIRHLCNSYHHNLPVFEGMDGQVIENNVACELFRIYEESAVRQQQQMQHSRRMQKTNY